MGTQRKASMALLFPILIICVIFTIFQGWIPHWGALWIFLLLACGISINVAPDYFHKRGGIYLLVYAFFLLFNYLTGDFFWGRSFITPLTELCMLFCGPAITYYVFSREDVKVEDRIVNWSIAVILLMAISSLFLDIVTPGIIRRAARMRFEFQDNSLSQYLYRYGGSNYNLPHSLPILFPALVFAFKNTENKGRKVILLIVMGLMIALIWISGAFTALLLGLISLFTSFFLSGINARRDFTIIGLLFLVALPVTLNDDIALGAIGGLQSIAGEDSFFYERFEETSTYIVTGETEGDMTTRMDLYKTSLEAGFNNFLLGTNGEIGGHSTIIDHFATLGISGLLLFIFIIINAVRLTVRYLPGSTRSFYYLGIITGLMLLLIKQMGNIEVWLAFFTFLPLIIHQTARKLYPRAS